MNEAELKSTLAQMDAEIKKKSADIEDAQLDLRHMREKRRSFARRNCSHPDTYERSIMGREFETRCKVCGEEV